MDYHRQLSRLAFNEENTPNLWELAKSSQVFDRHFSGGNGTRAGMFSMFYGLPGFYWNNVLRARRGPVLIQRLKDAGYQMRIISGTSLTFPEFRQTVFADVNDQIVDNLDGGDSRSA